MSLQLKTILSLALCIILLFPACRPSPSSDLEKKVDEWLKPLLDWDLLSGSILIAKGREILLAKGYGAANREFDIPNTAETKFRLASLTKQFTAMAIMILEEKGLLSVYDTLDDFIPDFPQGDRISLHYLLTHTSGIVNYSRLPDNYRVWSMPHSIEEVIARFKDLPLRFQPGEQFEYSNSGYILLAYIIEKVSRQTYEEYLRENIFLPLGMNDTGMDSHIKILKNRATGHYNEGQRILQAPYLFIEYTSGAGALYSTIMDLYKWDRALAEGKLISPERMERAFSPFLNNYAYGWFVRQDFGRRVMEHRGGINGFVCMIQRYVDDDIVVIGLFNYVTTFLRELNQGLAALALDENVEPLLIPEGIEMAPESMADYVGDYKFGENFNFSINLENGALYFISPGTPKSQAIPQSDTRFFVKEANAMLTFSRDEDGRVLQMLIQQSEKQYPCIKIE